MNQRERVILIITVVVAGLTVGLQFLGDSAPSGESAVAASGDLELEQRRFRDNIELLNQGDKIRSQYKAIEVGLKEGAGNQRPETAFSNELFNLLTERLGAQNPRIETASFTAIPKVDDYCYVDIPLQIQGSYDQVMQLLREMDQLGLLIKTLKLGQRNRNQNDIVDLNLTVARLVKTDDRIQRILRRQARRG